VPTTKTVPDPVTAAAAELAKLRQEATSHDTREGQANAALEAIARDFPGAQAEADLALARGDGDTGAADHVRKLRLEQSNIVSILRGIALRRERLAWDLQATTAKLARAEARAALPAVATAELAQEALEEGFAHLAEVIANGVRAAIAALPRDDHRGVTEAFDEAALARWLVAQCSQARVNLDLARHVPHGTGTGPRDTLTNVLAVVETL
jgi:hypothetical protein